MSRGRRFDQDTLDRIAKNVVRYRKRAGFTQVELAERVGTSRPNLAMIETGRQCGNLPTFARIAEELDVSMDTLFWEKG